MTDLYPPEFTQQRLFTDGEAESLRKILITRRLAYFTAILLVFALLIVSATGVVLIRASQIDRGKTVDSAADAAHAAEEGTDKIQDCTTPGRECFRESQQRTADLVAKLIDNNQAASAAAASCAIKLPTTGLSDYQRYQTVLACVLRLLAKDQ